VVVRMIVGLVLTATAFVVAGRRVWWLKRLAFSGQPAPERVAYARSHRSSSARKAPARPRGPGPVRPPRDRERAGRESRPRPFGIMV
jgi:hypothetical protein